LNDKLRHSLSLDEIRERAFDANVNQGISIEQDYWKLKEGDFEKWQPMCYENPMTFFYQEKYLEAIEEHCRSLWIMSRFCKFLSSEWHRWNYERLKWETIHDQVKTRIDNMKNHKEPY